MGQTSVAWPRQGSQNCPVITLNSTDRDTGIITVKSGAVADIRKNIQQEGAGNWLYSQYEYQT